MLPVCPGNCSSFRPEGLSAWHTDTLPVFPPSAPLSPRKPYPLPRRGNWAGERVRLGREYGRFQLPDEVMTSAAQPAPRGVGKTSRALTVGGDFELEAGDNTCNSRESEGRPGLTQGAGFLLGEASLREADRLLT